MEENARKPYDGFMRTPYAKVLGLALSLVICILILAVSAVGSILYLLSGIILYIIPRLFHVKGFKPMAVLGVVFLVAATLIGAFAFSIPNMESHDVEHMSANGFSAAWVGDEAQGTGTVISVEYSGTGTPKIRYGAVNCGFSTVYGASSTMDMENVGTGYQVTLQLNEGTPYVIQFIGDSGNSNYAVINYGPGDLTGVAISGNLYNAALPTIAFFIILIVMTVMWKKAEELRVQMEADGRLYPKGEGVCKECGRIILPGMTVCRCGAPIIPPEGYKPPVRETAKSEDHFECSECGKPVPADSDVCPHCGARFDED